MTRPSSSEDGKVKAWLLQRPWREWSAPEFEVEADGPIPAGVDGEADPPLRLRSRTHALRVRVPRRHPGASPSAMAPEGLWAGVLALARSARGERPATLVSRTGRRVP